MQYREPLFRPPAEADSLIFQVAYGCPHNRCRFCAMYKRVRYAVRPEAEVLAEIAAAGARWPFVRRIFLADGDAMALPFPRLQAYLEALNRAFPRLARVNLYANASSILNKTSAELSALRALKLHTLYVGLESGCQELLDLFGKSESAEGMVEATTRARQVGFKCSVMVLIGLGGKRFGREHVSRSIAILNRMQPAILSALRFIPVAGLSLPNEFQELSEYQAVAELRDLIAGLELPHCVFRANHTSNPVPLGGRFPQDKELLLDTLAQQMASGLLDVEGPGILPLSL